MERSSFFNAVLNEEAYDRVYTAEDYARYFASFIGNGVFPNPSNNLQTQATGAMNIALKQGKAWINGYFYENTGDLTLSVDVADGVLNRIDRVVLRLDFINREIKAYIKKGTFANSPVAPSLTRNADAYELGIADIRINKGVTNIVQANITDLRQNSELCGLVAGVVDQIDSTDLFIQFTNAFNNQYNLNQGKYDKQYSDNQNKNDKQYSDNQSKFNTQYSANQSKYDEQYNSNQGQFNQQKTDNQQTFNIWFNSIKDNLTEQQATALQAQINKFKENGLMNITSELQNGNFATTDGWGAVNTSSFTVSGRTGSFTANANKGGINRGIKGGTITGHKYYAKVEVNANSLYRFGFGTSSVDTQGNGTWQRISLMLQATSTGHGYAIGDLATSDFKPINARKALVIDLTKTFGEGNEPSKEQMDIIMSYFENYFIDEDRHYLDANSKAVTQLVDQMKDTGHIATNLVINGNFSNGVTSWNIEGANASIDNGRCKVTATKQFGVIGQGFTNLVAGRKYYVRADVEGRTDNYVNFCSSAKYLAINGKNIISYIVEIPSGSSAIYFGDKRTSGFTPYYVNDVCVIDLTLLYGRGNEPTAEQLDYAISRFYNGYFEKAYLEPEPLKMELFQGYENFRSNGGSIGGNVINNNTIQTADNGVILAKKGDVSSVQRVGASSDAIFARRNVSGNDDIGVSMGLDDNGNPVIKPLTNISTDLGNANRLFRNICGYNLMSIGGKVMASLNNELGNFKANLRVNSAGGNAIVSRTNTSGAEDVGLEMGVNGGIPTIIPLANNSTDLGTMGRYFRNICGFNINAINGGSVVAARDIDNKTFKASLRSSGSGNATFSRVNGTGTEDVGVVLGIAGSVPTIFPLGNSNITNIGSPDIVFRDLWLGGYIQGAQGYTKLPNGMILQWGIANAENTSTTQGKTFAFPTTFPNMCFRVFISGTLIASDLSPTWGTIFCESIRKDGSAFTVNTVGDMSSYGFTSGYIAIGY